MSDQELNIDEMVKIATDALENVKGKNITVIHTQELTSLFSRLVIATGESNRQVKALARNAEEELKKSGYEIIGTEGFETGEWALIDAGDVVVHVMLPAVRDYYDIETLWGGAKPSAFEGTDKPWANAH